MHKDGLVYKNQRLDFIICTNNLKPSINFNYPIVHWLGKANDTNIENEIASRWHHSNAIVPRLAAATRVALGARHSAHSYICMSRQFISAAFKSCPHSVRTLLLFLRIGHLHLPSEDSTAVKRKNNFFCYFLSNLPYTRHYNPRFVYFLPHFPMRFIL